MKDIDSKRQREKQIVNKMIGIYCKKKHKTRTGLCLMCQELSDYAQLRTQRCPFMESKSFCSNCKVHCYQADMRIRIKEVMRFSGPWMLLYDPIKAVNHIVESRKERRRVNINGN